MCFLFFFFFFFLVYVFMTLYFHADYFRNRQVFLDSENLKTSSSAYFGGILKVNGHRTFKVIELFYVGLFSVIY